MDGGPKKKLPTQKLGCSPKSLHYKQTNLTLHRKFVVGQYRLFPKKCYLPKFYFQIIYWNHRSMLQILTRFLQIPGSFTVMAAEASKQGAKLNQIHPKDKTAFPGLGSRFALPLLDTCFFSKQASRTNTKENTEDPFRGVRMEGMLQHK